MFADRLDAARRLAARLSHLKGRHPLVLAIPRGAVPMADHIACALDGELDVVLVRKLGAPGNPEYAIGAVDEAGQVQLNPDVAEGIDPDYLHEEISRQRAVLAARRQAYGPAVDPTGRVVIVVDDGVATGSTFIAALRALRAQQPQRLIAAFGVAPPEALHRFSRLADEVVCLETPAWFGSVGAFYQDFPQVTDAEVMRLLQARTGASPDPAGHGNASSDACP
ncbi:MAG: phosphoribosyltransferase family protein [Candidatus Macondimonas sp.]|jgi:predicted phosphoribosyltransferase